MNFIQSQITEIIENLVNEDDGLNHIFQVTLEALMKSEREALS